MHDVGCLQQAQIGHVNPEIGRLSTRNKAAHVKGAEHHGVTKGYGKFLHGDMPLHHVLSTIQGHRDIQPIVPCHIQPGAIGVGARKGIGNGIHRHIGIEEGAGIFLIQVKASCHLHILAGKQQVELGDGDCGLVSGEGEDQQVVVIGGVRKNPVVHVVAHRGKIRGQIQLVGGDIGGQGLRQGLQLFPLFLGNEEGSRIHRRGDEEVIYSQVGLKIGLVLIQKAAGHLHKTRHTEVDAGVIRGLELKVKGLGCLVWNHGELEGGEATITIIQLRHKASEAPVQRIDVQLSRYVPAAGNREAF